VLKRRGWRFLGKGDRLVAASYPAIKLAVLLMFSTCGDPSSVWPMFTLNRATSRLYRLRPRFPLWFAAVLLCLLFLGTVMAVAQGDAPSAPSPAAATPTRAQTNASTSEISTHDEPTTFRVNVNLVLVRVVVRDSKGQAIGNLQKDDFLLFDNRKPQVISQFSPEQAGVRPKIKSESEDLNQPPGSATDAPTATVAVPDSYIAYLFDDVHLTFGDLTRARDAASHHLATMKPTDRVAIFTTSGRTMLDFTDDQAKLHQALFDLKPQPIASSGLSPCLNVSYYMGDLIENQHDPQALSVATSDALVCEFNNDTRFVSQAQQVADAAARQALDQGLHESHLALTVVNDVIRRLSVAPGQRSIVLVSPGFLTPQLEVEYQQAIDRAVKSQIVIGALDARGLYVVPPGGDISNPGPPSQISMVFKPQYEMSEASANSDILLIFTEATGGVFFHSNNDLDEGFRRVASTPEYSYVLGFSPSNLKLDGSFHSLKVSLKNPQKLVIQARRGYYAPKRAADPAQQAKQEIEDAVFSQEELHSLPVDLHTQFFKSSDVDAKLTVLAHIDVKRLRLRKIDGRNQNELTVVSALFNGNGNLVQGIAKTVTMKLKDDTLERKLASGITVRTSFDVKPGTYMVRLVVRDAEAQLLSAENDAVRIP